MANTGYVNKKVQAMYGIPYSQLTAEQKRILHEDSLRRAKLIKEREEAVLRNNQKAFDDEAKLERVLASIYRDTQKQILADVAETMAKVKKAGGTWSYANQSALTRSKGLFEQITAELNKLGQKEQIAFTQGLSNIYTDQFLRQVYELGQSIPVKANFNRLNPSLIRQTLDYPWSGAMFSDRIWLDKETLGRNLRVGLTQSMILGEGIPEITDRINKGIETSRYNAERLARTETKRVTYVAHDHAYADMGVEELEYRCANGGDHRTCGTCRGDNGKKYKRGQEPTLPRHPNCRCVYIPVVSDTFGDNELNELTGSVRGAENYEKWRKAQEAKLKKEKTLTPEEKKYQTAIAGVEAERKAKEAEITTMQADYDSLDTKYRGYSAVRRGLTEPQEVGFKTKAEFEAMDKALSKQMREIQEKIQEAQKDLTDLGRDITYLQKVGAKKADTLGSYREMRKALRNNSTFDYDSYADEFLEMAVRMDEDALTIHRKIATITEKNKYNTYDGHSGAHYSPWDKRVNMKMDSNTHERALGNWLKGSWQTKFHEEGHQLDHLFANIEEIAGVSNPFRAFTDPYTPTGKKIQKALEQDLLEFVNQSILYYNNAHKADTGFKAVKSITSFDRLAREVRYAFDEYWCSLTNSGMDRKVSCQMGILSDAIGLFTKDRLSRNTLSCGGWGHDSSYNKDRGKAGSASETWATFCALRTAGAKDEVKLAVKLMPNTWSVMDDIFHEIAVYLATNNISY